MNLTWHERGFYELSAPELYSIMLLRERVFIVEQRCIYCDADGFDTVARHLWAEPSGYPTVALAASIAAYLRILPAEVKYAEVSIGRVVTGPGYRGKGLGRELMERGIAAAGDVPIRISAQAHLEKFYAELGFARASEVYDEDGIPHVEMLRPASRESPT